jgi:hypothetical protein
MLPPLELTESECVTLQQLANTTLTLVSATVTWALLRSAKDIRLA